MPCPNRVQIAVDRGKSIGITGLIIADHLLERQVRKAIGYEL